MLNHFNTGQFDWLLKDYGPKFAGEQPRNPREHPCEKTDNFFKNINNAALANLPAWVQEIFPTAKFQPGTKAYRVSSADLGRDLDEDLSLHPDGIRDFGEETGLTPTDVVIEYGGASTPQEAAFALLRWLGISPETMGWNPKATPQSKPGLRKWPEPLGEHALHGLAGEVVRAIEPQTEADPVALLLQFLVAFGNCVGRIYYYMVEGDRHYPNLFAVIVGQSSKARKGTSWGRIRPLFQGAGDWLEHRTDGGLSSGEGMIYPVRDPVKKMMWDSKTKQLEEKIEDAGVNDKRLLVQETEFSGVLNVKKREGNTLSRLIRDAWDRGNLASMTKNSQLRATGAHISMVGHITEDELRRELTQTDAANGFANRYLYACVKRSKILPFGGKDSDVIAEVGQKVTTLVDTLRRRSFAHTFGDTSSTFNPELTWSSDARALWESVYPQLSEGHPGMFGSITGRAEAQVCRLALIYALLDGSNIMEVVHLRAALEVWRYCEQSAAYIWGDAFGDSAVDTVLQALRAAGTAGMTRTQISSLFDRHKSGQDLARALNVLLARQLVRMETRATGGRSEEVWRVI